LATLETRVLTAARRANPNFPIEPNREFFENSRESGSQNPMRRNWSLENPNGHEKTRRKRRVFQSYRFTVSLLDDLHDAMRMRIYEHGAWQ